jgi:hypothetical protein
MDDHHSENRNAKDSPVRMPLWGKIVLCVLALPWVGLAMLYAFCS